MSNLHRTICEAISKQGGRAYLVGGCVRDMLLHQQPKDIDCEVYGMTPEALQNLLAGYGEVDMSGEPFGVYTLKKEGFDFALPRVERRTGGAHTDFEVTPVPDLTPEEAAARRDFTVNAIMMDALTGEIVDPYGGRADLEGKILRAVPGGQFEEDPLRVLRGAQFCARFDLFPDIRTLIHMRNMKLGALSAHRVMDETKKALLNAQRPDVFFSVLRDAHALAPWFEELEEEGVFKNTLSMLKEAAALRGEAKDPLAFMLAALVSHTQSEEEAGRLLERLGVGAQTAKYCLDMRTNFVDLKTAIEKRFLMAYTMHILEPDKSVQDMEFAYIMLMLDGCTSAEDAALLVMADSQDEKDRGFVRDCLQRYREACARPMPTGDMFLAVGVEPGPDMKAMLKIARKKTLLGMDAEDAVKETMEEEFEGFGEETDKETDEENDEAFDEEDDEEFSDELDQMISGFVDSLFAGFDDDEEDE